MLGSILSFVMFFQSLKTQPVASPQVINMGMAQYLLAALYGVLLAVICFIPCWKLMGKSASRPLTSTAGGAPASTARPGRKISAAIGYILFLSFLTWFFPLHSIALLIAIKPAVFVVLGGSIAMVLFMRGSGQTISTAFAAMGLIGSLLGIIQMLFGFTMGMQGIGQVAGALAYFIASCLTALLGMVV